MTVATTTDDGYTWIEKTVTRKGKQHKQWFRVKVKGAAKTPSQKLVAATAPVPAPVVHAKKEDFYTPDPGDFNGFSAPSQTAVTVPPPAPPKLTDSQNIVHKQLGKQLGSNPGGTYEGQDGVKRYVKFYENADQALGEQLTNKIYQDLHGLVPNTTLFQHGGKTAIASDLIEGHHGMLSSHVGDKDVARDFLKSFTTDVLTANWDAAGLTLDNALVRNGAVYRIDAGGSLLRRASGALKPEGVLNAIPEWEGFFNTSKNPSYSKVAATAGITKAEQLGNQLHEDVKWIQKLEKKHGGWDNYVRKTVPELDKFPEQREKIVAMLMVRSKLIAAKVALVPPGDPGKGFKYVQKEVVKKGKVHKQWFKVKEAEVGQLTKKQRLLALKAQLSHEEQGKKIEELKVALGGGKTTDTGLSYSAKNQLGEQANKAYAPLSVQEKSALLAFTGSSYKSIRAVQAGMTLEQFKQSPNGNKYMSEDSWKHAEKNAGHLATAQASLSITEPTQHGVLHRGMNVSRETLYEMLHGEAVTHNGFSTNSTSYKRSVSEGFMSPEDAATKTYQQKTGSFEASKEYPVMLRYNKVKLGANLMYYENISSHEQEIGVGRGTFKILSRKYVQGAAVSHGYFEFDVEQIDD